MSEKTLTRFRLIEGVWEGHLTVRGKVPPNLLLRHRNELLEDNAVEVSDMPTEEGKWLVRFRLPTEKLSDGIQTFLVEDASTGDVLAHETIFAGDQIDDGIRAEVSLLRAELDLLKRSFRRHCSES